MTIYVFVFIEHCHNVIWEVKFFKLLCWAALVHIELFIQVFVMQYMLNAINNTEEEEEIKYCVTVTFFCVVIVYHIVLFDFQSGTETGSVNHWTH